jgi:DHA2 family multidrug resistance protein-like MFS transporter
MTRQAPRPACTKWASSLGAAFGVAISAAFFTSLSGLNTSFGPLSDLFLGRTDNVGIRSAAAVALSFNVMMVIIAILANRYDCSQG